MPRKLDAYECEHCRKRIYRSKAACVRHERRCYWNPVTRACVTCDHFDSEISGCTRQPGHEGTLKRLPFGLTYGCPRWWRNRRQEGYLSEILKEPGR